MSDAKQDRARRAVACPGWRWMRGMTDDRGDTVIGSDAGDVTVCSGVRGRVRQARGALPDLDDAATLGCLLALVREAWGDPGLSTVFRHGLRKAWCCRSTASDRTDDAIGATEAEALVAALEAAGGAR